MVFANHCLSLSTYAILTIVCFHVSKYPIVLLRTYPFHTMPTAFCSQAPYQKIAWMQNPEPVAHDFVKDKEKVSWQCITLWHWLLPWQRHHRQGHRNCTQSIHHRNGHSDCNSHGAGLARMVRWRVQPPLTGCQMLSQLTWNYLIWSISEILQQKLYHCGLYTKPNKMNPVL